MGSFEWMELQTLTSDINASRSRLAAARANKDNRLIRVLEAEITEAEARRDRLLANITTNLAGSGEPAQNPPAATEAEAAEPTPAEPAVAKQASEDEQPAAVTSEETSDEQVGSESAGEPAEREAPALAQATADGAEGGGIVWDQLTPSDIERAQAALGTRREEMLARHAEELKALEVEQAELEGLERAINAFVQRLTKTGAPPQEAKADAA